MPDARFAWINSRELDWAERRAIERSLAHATSLLGLRSIGVAAYVGSGDRRSLRSRSFVQDVTWSGFTDPVTPDRVAVLVGAGRLRYELARTVAHEVRHAAQLARHPAVWADPVLRERDAEAFGERVLGELVDKDDWWLRG